MPYDTERKPIASDEDINRVINLMIYCRNVTTLSDGSKVVMEKLPDGIHNVDIQANCLNGLYPDHLLRLVIPLIENGESFIAYIGTYWRIVKMA